MNSDSHNCNYSKDVIGNPQSASVLFRSCEILCLLCTRLTISLIATVGLSFIAFDLASPTKEAHAAPPLDNSNQPNVKAMLEQGRQLYEKGNYEASAAIYRRSLGILEKTLGLNHQDVATALNDLAVVMVEQAQYGQAELLLGRALMIAEKVYGSDHPYVARVLHNQGLIMSHQDKYSAAEHVYRRALAILKKSFAPDDLQLAQTMNNLALIIGPVNNQYAEAELLLERALMIREKALGSNDPQVAQSVSSLGELLGYQGKYTAAEQNKRRALAIREKAFGPNHIQVAYSLNNLAEIIRKQGRYRAAESLARRGLNILEKNLGQNHPYVARVMNNLAIVMIPQGQHAPAELLLRRALAINEKALGSNHLAVAQSLRYLALLLGKQGKYSEAEPLERRGLAIEEKILGLDHTTYASSLHSHAVTLWSLGRYSEAGLLLRRSLAIFEKARSTDSPEFPGLLANLAILLSSNQDFDGAIAALGRSLTIESTWLLRELPLLPDQARSAQLLELGRGWELSFNWIDNHPLAAKLALDNRLNRQGLLPTIENLQRMLLNSPDVDRVKIDQLRAITQQMASASLPPDLQAATRERREKLQAEIYRRIPELRIQLITTAEVAKSLPADGVLVEFQRYQPYDGRKPEGKRWGPAQYIALVLKPNGSISAVQLGTAAEIDAQVHHGLLASAQQLSDTEEIWRQLSTQVLKPLLPQLSGSNQWFLSPDGELNRVPFAALPAPQQLGTPLAQVVQLRLLTTGRELLRLQQPSPGGGSAVVMANPSYDRPSAKPASILTPKGAATVALRRSAELGIKRWMPLPATEREGQQVARLLSTALINGDAATTKTLQGLQGPRVLHVATHGFFVADQETKPTEPMRAIQEGSSLLRSLRQEDPMLRSGLVFAGANQPDVDPKDDGYLTAAEAVNLNLKGTELVVLSACSTGQGEVRTGEGVYGLQRSLTVAGARSTLLSLWKVDDAATAEFMSRYYQRLKDGEGRSDALAAVQEEFRSGKVQSANGVNWKEPYYWAAWQLVGDWRPIPGL